MPRKKKLQTYVRDEVYKYLERSAKKSKTSVSLEAARLLEEALGLSAPAQKSQVVYAPPDLSDELEALRLRVEGLENQNSKPARLDPSRRGRRGR